MGFRPFLKRAAGCTLATFLTVLQSAGAVKFQPTTQVQGTQQAEFNIFLPLTHSSELTALLKAQQTPGSAEYHKWLTPAQFTHRFGPNGADVAKVSKAVESYGLQVVATHSQGIRVRGEASAIERVFSTSLWNGVGPHGSHRLITTGRLTMPDALAQAHATVVAFSPLVRNHTHSRNLGRVNAAQPAPENRISGSGPYWFTDIKQAYNFPSYKAVTGKGVNIGILMSSDYNANDMAKYFGHEKLAAPKVVRRPVDGGADYDPANNDTTFEAALDLQQAGGMAPGATLYLYNVPDLSDSSIFDGYLEILNANEVDIVNSSFGGAEALYSAEYNNGISYVSFLGIFESLFSQGNAQGITFVASSGDSGALETPPLAAFTADPTTPESVVGYFLPGVSTPASSQYVTAVGGTNLITTYDASGKSQDSRYVAENAYGDPEMPYDAYGTGNEIAGGYWGSGGGISQFVPKPDYQSLVQTGSTDYRTIPDVSLHMGGCPGGISYPCGDDRSSVVVAVGGDFYAVIGTSASAPEFAGLLALREELSPGRIGNANYLIYSRAKEQFNGSNSARYFHSGVPGFNGYYQTHYGYNYVLGNGTVSARDFIGAQALPGAGEPGAPSNP